MKPCLVTLLAVLVLAPSRGHAAEPVIYGADNRHDLYEVTDRKELKAADASVSLFKSWSLQERDGEVSVKSEPLKKAQNLCANQPFADQPTAPFCSGSLVAPEVVLTAGHCVKNFVVCAGIQIAFGYTVPSPGVMPGTLPASEVYGCKEVIHSQSRDGKPDFALIRLDRPVTNHAPLALDRAANQQVGDPVFMVGYPNGLPAKVSDGANIRAVNDTNFVSNLNSFTGNSGSPVFSAQTGLVEGILVDGDTDYVWSQEQSCNLMNRCPSDGCSGETATSISVILPYLDRAFAD